MKKLLLLSIVASGTAVTAFGQSHLTPFKNHFPACHSGAAAKTTTGNWQRCIAMVASETAGPLHAIMDSMTFAYSGAHGGSFMGPMKYDNAVTYMNFSGSLVTASNSAHTFDSHDNILTDLQQQYDFSTSTLVNSGNNSYTYDAANNQLTETDKTWNTSTSAWENTAKYVRTYTAGNLISSQTMLSWSGTAWQNSSQDAYSYTSTNKPLMDVSKAWNIMTSAWENDRRTTNTYDASDNMISQLNETWTGSTWANQNKITFSNFTAAGLYQKAIVQNWDPATSTFLNGQKDSLTYNAYNQPVYYFDIPWSSTANSWNNDTFMQMHFYYELYSTGVAQLNGSATTLDVYPNPASGILNLRAMITEGSNTTISLMDVTGRVVNYIGSNIREGQNNIQYPVEQLPAGTYFVHLTNEKADITKKIVIVK